MQLNKTDKHQNKTLIYCTFFASLSLKPIAPRSFCYYFIESLLPFVLQGTRKQKSMKDMFI